MPLSIPFTMPRLSKSKNNKKTHRLSIEDEYIEWAGWDKDEFIIIDCDESINVSNESVEKTLILRSIRR